MRRTLRRRPPPGRVAPSSQGAPMRRRLAAVLAASLASLVLGVGAATADPAADASAAVTGFLNAAIARDYAGMCGDMTTSFKDVLFDGDDCATSLAESAAEDSNESDIQRELD